MNKIYKTLVYFFYCRDDINEYKEVFDLHLELLKKNINIFNYSKFILAFNDLNNNELIDFYKNYIQSYLEINNNFEFIIVQNEPLNREGIYFYYEVVKKLNEYDGLLFFGHNKSDLVIDKQIIYDWLIGTHFINFYDINDVENKLIYDKYMAYGGFPTYLIEQREYIHSIYFYDGTFFWINPKKLINLHYHEIQHYTDFFEILLREQKNESIIKLDEFRFFAEIFLNNVCNFKLECTTLNGFQINPIYIYHLKPSESSIKNLIYNIELFPYFSKITKHYLSEEQNIEFNEYFNNICQKLNIIF